MTTEAQCLAWRSMRRLRTCPPLRILKSGSAPAVRHLAICPSCAEKMAHTDAAATMGQLLDALDLPRPDATPPAPGDVRSLRPSSPPESWFDEDGIFHNPPLLLVLDAPDDDGWVRVSQIFDEADLQSFGDIPLEDGIWGYAEAWNIFTVPHTELSAAALHKVDREHVEQVCQMAGRSFPALDECSPLFHFRQGELELGSFFSLRCNLALLQEREASLPQSRGKVIRFAAALRSGDRAPLPSDAQKDCLQELLERLEKKQASADELPLAAATAVSEDRYAEKHGRIPVVMIHDDDGSADTVHAAEASLRRLADKSHMTLTCTVPEHWQQASVAATCQTAEIVEALAGWDDDMLEIDIMIAGTECQIEDMRVAIVLSSQEQHD